MTGKPRLEKYIFDFDLLGPPGQSGEVSRSSSPRFIVDRQGAVRWPPFKIGGEAQSDPEQSEELGIENFTLKKPQSDHSSEAPCVLGWLQVSFCEIKRDNFSLIHFISRSKVIVMYLHQLLLIVARKKPDHSEKHLFIPICMF